MATNGQTMAQRIQAQQQAQAQQQQCHDVLAMCTGDSIHGASVRFGVGSLGGSGIPMTRCSKVRKRLTSPRLLCPLLGGSFCQSTSWYTSHCPSRHSLGIGGVSE